MKPRFLDLAEVLEIHQSRIELYGGSPGIRDFGLLQSVLAQPSAGLGEELFHIDLYDMAAAYLFHLSRNHPFVDGNKRTALACRLVFLAYNSIEIESNPSDLEQLAVDTAAGGTDKKKIAAFFRNHAK